jgi:hypothetical protein
LQKALKGAKSAAQVGLAAAKVVSKLTNPVTMGKVALGAARGKGLVYPGSTYIGPGNPLPKKGEKHKAKSKADLAALQHDRDYDALLKRGVKPSKLYTGFSDADQRLIDKSDVRTEHGLVTFLGMNAKKGLQKAGLTGPRIKDGAILGPGDLRKRVEAMRRVNEQ